MPVLRRWDSGESDVNVGPCRYDPTSSSSSASPEILCCNQLLMLLYHSGTPQLMASHTTGEQPGTLMMVTAAPKILIQTVTPALMIP